MKNIIINHQTKFLMRISLSTAEALAELNSLYDLGENPGFDFPAFCIETEFISLFVEIIEDSPGRKNIVPFMNHLINRAFQESIDHICNVLDQYKADGTEIYELMSEKKPIRNRAKRAYNKKIRGRAPKGLTIPYCSAYNSWLLAGHFWRAYVRSHDPEFRVTIREHEDWEAPIETFYSSEYRPLWAMKQAYLDAGRPAYGLGYEDINIKPHGEWNVFIKKHETVDLPKKRFNRV